MSFSSPASMSKTLASPWRTTAGRRLCCIRSWSLYIPESSSSWGLRTGKNFSATTSNFINGVPVMVWVPLCRRPTSMWSALISAIELFRTEWMIGAILAIAVSLLISSSTKLGWVESNFASNSSIRLRIVSIRFIRLLSGV